MDHRIDRAAKELRPQIRRRMARPSRSSSSGCARIFSPGGRRAGSRLVEWELTSRFAVSRGPVREALRRLAAEGLIEHQPHRGALVRRLVGARDPRAVSDPRRNGVAGRPSRRRGRRPRAAGALRRGDPADLRRVASNACPNICRRTPPSTRRSWRSPTTFSCATWRCVCICRSSWPRSATS